MPMGGGQHERRRRADEPAPLGSHPVPQLPCRGADVRDEDGGLDDAASASCAQRHARGAGRTRTARAGARSASPRSRAASSHQDGTGGQGGLRNRCAGYPPGEPGAARRDLEDVSVGIAEVDRAEAASVEDLRALHAVAAEVVAPGGELVGRLDRRTRSGASCRRRRARRPSPRTRGTRRGSPARRPPCRTRNGAHRDRRRCAGDARARGRAGRDRTRSCGPGRGRSP